MMIIKRLMLVKERALILAFLVEHRSEPMQQNEIVEKGGFNPAAVSGAKKQFEQERMIDEIRHPQTDRQMIQLNEHGYRVYVDYLKNTLTPKMYAVLESKL